MADDIYFNRKAQSDNNSRYVPPQTRAVNPYLERVDAPAGQPQAGGVRRPADPYARPAGAARPVQTQPGRSAAPAQPPKKKKKAGKVVAIILVVCLVLGILGVGALGVGVAVVLGNYQPEAMEDNAYISESSLTSSAGVYNVLLIGIDSSDTTAATRSDSMIIMSIDSVHSKIKLTSIMRDSFVQIPGYEMAKLNAACSRGGPQLVADTIEYNFGIRIDAYVKIGYDVLVRLVDGIGGITVPEITEREAQFMGYEGVTVTPGTNVHLDGAQTLQYCRIRKDAATSDFRRTERQREALTLIIKKMMKTNPVKLVGIARELVGMVQCSVSKSGMLPLAMKAIPCLLGEIENGRVPADGTYYSGSDSKYGSVLVVDVAANSAYLKDFIYG